ncbi:MAG: bifunctional 3,4-dihydroxy-2-butanone-4-phosphate synthase/GTP cyclohydrolase II [Phycisphaerales bacterium]
MLDTAFSTIDEVLADLRQGKMVVLTDDEDRENEGDIVMAAEFVTPEAINFMVREAAGYLFVSLTEADCDRLNLHPQTETNTSVRGTPLMVSIDGHPRHGFTTGVSAAARAKTIKMTLDPSTVPSDFVRPGHINPLRARDGGVLVRIGQTEGSVDLCKLAGLTPAAVGIEICNPDGTMARLPDLTEFIKKHDMKMCSVKQIIEYRLKRSGIVDRLDPKPGTKIETPEGEFNLVAFQSVVDPLPHLALTLGDVGALDSSGRVIESDEPTLVRVHRRDLLGDIFLASSEGQTGSSGDVLRASMRAIQKEGRGALVYLRPHGVGDGLSQRLTRPAGHSVEDAPQQSVSAPMLEYGVGCQLVRALGISKIRLLSNSSMEYPQIEAFGLEIVDRVPLSAK